MFLHYLEFPNLSFQKAEPDDPAGKLGPRRRRPLHTEPFIVKPGGSIAASSWSQLIVEVLLLIYCFASFTNCMCCTLNTNQATRKFPKFCVFGPKALRKPNSSIWRRGRMCDVCSSSPPGADQSCCQQQQLLMNKEPNS